MSGSFTQVFGGTTIYPADVSYLALALTDDIALNWPVGAGEGDSVVARIIDITPTGPFTVTLPDATAVSVGQTVLFNNLGPDTITINNAAGNAILSIGAGEQWQAYLINNTTIGGVWRTFRYGAAVAQAQAAALAGAGLIADGSELAQNYDVTDFSITPYSLTSPDRAKVFVWNGGLGTLNLPTAVAAGDGWFVQVRNGGQGDLTIDPAGSELINAASSLRLQPGDSAVVVSDGIQWYTIGLGQQAVFAFDYTTIAVTGGTYTLSGSELNRISYRFNGTLTSNVTIVVPATVQQYWVNNATTAPFTLGLQASGSATTTLVTQGETAIVYCDGTDIIPATTSSPFSGILPVLQGGTGANNATSARTNLGATGIGSALFTAATSASARSTIAAAAAGANSDITSITGLTTALTVAQGGTGSTTAGGARTNLGAAASGSNADITALTNAAGIQIGAPTLGARGVGTINATGLFINGVGVGTGSGSVTSVAMSVPSFLSVSGSPVTTSGTLAVTLSGTALPVANGGTGQTTYTNGQLLIGNTTGNTLTKATLTAGTGISITNGTGSITIASTGGSGTVTSVAASGGTTGLSFSGTPITTSGTLTLAGTLAIASGGTGATSASGARLNLSAAASGANADITSLTGLTTALTVAQGGTGVATTPTNGQVLIGNGAGYTLAGITAGSGITVTNSAGGITIASTSGGGSVTSVDVSGGTTGLTSSGGPITGAGTITLAGTLELANGGSGSTTAAGARTNFNVPSRTGADASGTWAISVSGNAATATDGVVTTGTYSNPAWITALAGSKVSGNITGNAGNVTGTVAIANGGTGATTAALARTALDVPTRTGTDASGTWGISISGNAATATNGVVTTGSYSNPAWITALAGSKISGDITGNAANVTGTVAVANGGTGQTTYTNGQLLIGNTTGNTLTKATLTAGSGISITNGTGAITIAATGASGTVTSVEGSGGTTGLSLSGGPITTTGTLTLGGTLALANGGTGSTTAAGARTNLDVPSNSGSGATGTWAISVSGNAATATNGVVTTASYTDPSFISTLAGTKISGNIGGNAANVTGTVAVANGGTGQTTYTNGQLLIGNTTGNTLTKATLTAGSGISITNGGGSITIASTGGGGTGTVTSVDVSGGTTGLTTSGGPVTSAGTITLAGTLAVANGGTGATDAGGARTNLSVPSTTGGGASGTWGISISGNAATATNGVVTTGTYADPAWITSLAGSKISGTVAVLNGGTGSTTAAGAQTNLDVPSRGGSGASGTWGISISGNAATATNGVVTTGSYPDPTWITSLSASKIAGTLAVDKGGTGQTTYTDGQLLIGNTTGNTLTKTTLTAGSGISITNGNGSITIASSAAGTVTSVSGSGGTTGLTLSGGPITSSGTLTIGGTLAVANGGTGAGDAGTARTNLDVPSRGGSGASGTWGINVTGNAATATNGIVSTASYSDPAWITSLAGSKISGNITGNAATATTANATNTSNNFQMNSLGVGTPGSATAGEIRATNNVTAFYSSDARLKENVRPIENALGVVSAVGGKTFDWTDAYLAEHGGEDGYFVRKGDFGVIAQDVREMFPLAVREREDGTLAVDYEKLVAVAFAAIAELKAEVDELRGAK
jgi:hypothetical protein